MCSVARRASLAARYVMHLSSASLGFDPRDTQGLLLRGRNKTLTKPLSTGESLITLITKLPLPPGQKSEIVLIGRVALPHKK